MTVTILGNNSALPAYGRHPTAQIVQVGGKEILIDCGEGTQMRMQDFGIRWRNLEHICISHLHGDHYFGIFGLLTSMSLLGRTSELHLYAPAPLEGMIQNMMGVSNSAFCYPYHFHPLPEGAALLIETKHFRLHCFPTEHRIDCHGFLIEEADKGRKLLPAKCRDAGIPQYFYDKLKKGEDYERTDGTVIKNEDLTEAAAIPKRYAYCADSLYTDSFLLHIMNVDLLYHESTYLQMDEERATARFHSTAEQAAQIALKCGAKKLLLGHYSSRYKEVIDFETEAKTVFENAVASVEGQVYEL